MTMVTVRTNDKCDVGDGDLTVFSFDSMFLSAS